MSIEKKIWQTYETIFDELPIYAKESVGTWTHQNPG
jgi:mannosyltransferase OCH1-like enzyme